VILRARTAAPRKHLRAGLPAGAALAISLLCGVPLATLQAAPEAAATATVAGIEPPSAPARGSIEPSFAPDRARALTAVTVAGHFSTGPAGGGLPSPLREMVIWAPAGLAAPDSLAWPRTSGCSVAHLRRHGARGCPPRSQIGSGSAVVGWDEGSRAVTETARVKVFVGPTTGGAGVYAFEVLAEGRTPLRKRVVLTESLYAVAAPSPYSASLHARVPPIATRPGEPDASVLSFRMTLRRAHGGHGLGERVPARCPAGGYPWAASFGFADGTQQHVSATVPCPA
jgi:hypothetical protein